MLTVSRVYRIKSRGTTNSGQQHFRDTVPQNNPDTRGTRLAYAGAHIAVQGEPQAAVCDVYVPFDRRRPG